MLLLRNCSALGRCLHQKITDLLLMLAIYDKPYFLPNPHCYASLSAPCQGPCPIFRSTCKERLVLPIACFHHFNWSLASYYHQLSRVRYRLISNDSSWQTRWPFRELSTTFHGSCYGFSSILTRTAHLHWTYFWGQRQPLSLSASFRLSVSVSLGIVVALWAVGRRLYLRESFKGAQWSGCSSGSVPCISSWITSSACGPCSAILSPPKVYAHTVDAF